MAIVPDDVRDILPGDIVFTDDQIQAAIDASQCLLDQFSASFCGETFSAACLDQIHLYLAAHFLCVTNPALTITSETSDGCCKASAKYGWQLDNGIMGTPFGQMANTLSGGCLQEYDKQPANIFAIGSHGGQAQEYFV